MPLDARDLGKRFGEITGWLEVVEQLRCWGDFDPRFLVPWYTQYGLKKIEGLIGQMYDIKPW